MMKKLFYLFLGAIFLIPFERIGSLEFFGINLRFSQILIMAIFFSYLIYCLANRKFKVKIHPSLIFYIIFLAVSLVSIMFAREKMRGIVVLAFLSFMFVIPYLTCVFINTRERMKIALYVFLISSFVFTLFGFFQFFGDLVGLPSSITGISDRYAKDVIGLPRIQSTFIEPLYFANYLIMPIVLTIFFVIKRLDKKRSIKFVALFLFFLSAFILTFSKGAIAAISIVLLGVLLSQARYIFNQRNLKYFLVTLSILIVTGTVAMISFRAMPDFSKIYNRAYSVIMGGSILERQEAYTVAIDAFNSSPIIGVGVGGFGPYFSGYPTSAPDYGWPIANNQYLEILAEMGTVGLLAFLVFIISIFYYSYIAYRKTDDKLLKTVLLALNFSFLGILLQYMTFSTLYIMHIWILIGLILASHQIILEEKKTKG